MSLKKVHTKSEVHSSPLLLFRKPEFFPYILAHHHHHKQTINVPKLQGLNYVVKNCALVVMLKVLPLAQFLSALLLKLQMIVSIKNIEHARQISAIIIY